MDDVLQLLALLSMAAAGKLGMLPVQCSWLSGQECKHVLGAVGAVQRSFFYMHAAWGCPMEFQAVSINACRRCMIDADALLAWEVNKQIDTPLGVDHGTI